MKKFAAEVESNEVLKAKLRSCKTQEEIEAVARENNFEFPSTTSTLRRAGNVEQSRTTIIGMTVARATLAIASGFTDRASMRSELRSPFFPVPLR